MISHLEIVEVPIDRDGVVYAAGALTGVLTFPSFRREGWGGRLVRHAVRRIEASDADLGLICCRPETGDFYARASGWGQLPDVQVVVGDTREVAEPTPQVALTRFLSDRARADRNGFEGSTLWLRADL